MDESNFKEKLQAYFSVVHDRTFQKIETTVATVFYGYGFDAGAESQRQVGPCGKHPAACWVRRFDHTSPGPKNVAAYCTVCASEQALRAEIAAREAELTTLRDKLRGLAESWVNDYAIGEGSYRQACAQELRKLLGQETT